MTLDKFGRSLYKVYSPIQNDEIVTSTEPPTRYYDIIVNYKLYMNLADGLDFRFQSNLKEYTFPLETALVKDVFATTTYHKVGTNIIHTTQDTNHIRLTLNTNQPTTIRSLRGVTLTKGDILRLARDPGTILPSEDLFIELVLQCPFR